MWSGGGLADKLRGRLAVLYGPMGAAVADRVIQLVEHYAPRIRPRRKTVWDERDIILITYGDQIQDRHRPALEVLEEFLCANGLVGLFQILHILPFFPYSSDDGFSVIDYRQVRPELGTWEHIRRLGERFDLMIDLVLNHVSRKSVYFQRYLAREEPFVRFFIEAHPDPALVHVVRPRASPLLTPVDTKAGRRYVWTTFSEDQIDWNYAEPQVLLEMLDILLFYVEQGARIIRLDAIAYLWKRIGTPCIHLPETHEVVKLFRDILDAVAPGTLLLTETNVPHAENVSYFGQGDEAHLVYQFSVPALLLEAFISGQADCLASFLEETGATPVGTSVVNFTASHDGIGVRGLENLLPQERMESLLKAVLARGGLINRRMASDGSQVPYELNITYYSALADPGCAGSTEHVRRFLASQAFMLALQGIPAVYFHSLVATPNDLEGVKRTGQNRSINRRKFQLQELTTLLERGEVPETVFRAYRRLIEIRISQPAFHPEAPQRVVPTGNKSLIALERQSFDRTQQILVLLNVGREPARVPESLLCGRKVVGDLLAPWPELAILREGGGLPGAMQPYSVSESGATIPAGGIVWWQVEG
jgi:sucrose phosphorylase